MTSQKLNRDDPDILIPLNRTTKRVDAKLGIKYSNAEATTVARANACASVRNAVSFVAISTVVYLSSSLMSMAPSSMLAVMISVGVTLILEFALI